MDISKFGHFYDFNLSTESLGQISVGTITGAIDEELRKRRNELYEASEREFGLILLQILGRKNVEEGNEQVKLGRPDVEVLTDTELARFADIFIDKNQWLFEDLDSPIHERHEDEEGKTITTVRYEKIDLSRKDGESSLSYLRRLLLRYQDIQSKHLKRLTDSLRFPNIGDSISKLLEQNQAISTNLGRILDFHPLRTTALPPQPIEIPKLPENPVYETNRRISEATTYIEDIRSVVEEAARLLKSMNDLSLNLLATFTSSARQTGRHNSILIGIAIVTLIVSAWISYLNYRDTGRDVAGARAVLSTLVDVSSTSGGRIAERLASVSKLLESSLSESGLRLNANNQAIGVSNAELERIRLELEGIRSDNVRVLKELNAVMRESNGAVNK